ncbi:MAG: hypothetical protein CMK60_00655 [Proteobacteria bacterium]|jgi:drug/metabolite transporter (DMT)-like permease|nr:hypothetical protein [Pseudomonadota bacterium]MBP09063.1 hypothetical protein [Acidiferrobacteraceae bacterium]MDP7221156.1 EamA family transporter [Arenicellales bacterium]HJP10469.1 EamA family transporter [Arenicellales bacterium]|tara:strand:- start:135 stop:1046 length:912 start_codon:yes stop_codon:yes gene_type:complete
MSLLWIPVTITAAFFQNLRSAVQRHLKSELSDMGAASVRFIYAWPFAMLGLALTLGYGYALPEPTLAFGGWVIAGSIAQITFTFLLMWLFSLSNFTVGTALSKTEVIQVAILQVILLQETISAFATFAVLVATVGVLVMTAAKTRLSLGGLFSGFLQKSTAVGLACGFFLGLSAVLFRGALVSLEGESVLVKSTYTLAVATVFQSIIMAIWLRRFQPGQISRTFSNWRVCISVGFSGWIGSNCWFVAFALTNVAFVRALGQVELLFTFLASVLIFREKVTRTEIVGVLLLTGGIILLVLDKAS